MLITLFGHVSKCVSFLLQKEMTPESSSSQGSRPVWDTRFNRALNVVMGKKPGTKLETGRVVGGGNGATWDYYYHESTEKRKERKRMVDASIVE